MPSVKNCINGLFIALIGCGMAACSNLKYLQEGETLYVGGEVEVTDSLLSPKDRKRLADNLEEDLRPRPNSSLFGIRIKLWLYNIAGEPKSEKGFRHWLKYKMGEPPVLGSEFNLETNEKILSNQLQNLGYFSAFALGEKVTENQKTKAMFDVRTGPQTIIKDVFYDLQDSSGLMKDIIATKQNSLIQSGKPYNLDNIKNERSRIGEVLNNRGYFYFNPDYILLEADTGAAPLEMNLAFTLKHAEMPRTAYRRYKINDVFIHPNYRMTTQNNQQNNERGEARRYRDTTEHGDFKIVGRNRQFKPTVFHQVVQLKPGEYYNKRDQNIALNRLVTLGTFKFVKNEFTPVRGDSLNNLLNLSYFLSPYPRKAFNIEVGGFTLNDSRAGSRASIAWRNRNIFKGAELFTLKLSGGFEAQYGGEVRRPNTYNLGIESSLNIPRFLVPFVRIRPSGMFVPRTILNLGYNYSLRKDFYKIYTVSFGFGYNWKEDAMKDHKLYPINLSIVKTDTLDVERAEEINLNNLVFNGIILGPSYEYTYNSRLGRPRKHNFFFMGRADFSGNIPGLIQGTDLDEPPRKLFGSAYAQYLKLETDLRHYMGLGPKMELASRLYFGFGYPYGNSYQLPNIKQFFSGGASSLRGFPSRLVGPGTFNEDHLSGQNTFIEMLGDIKAEFNTELRINLYKFIHTAVFVDAGNIWLFRDNPDFPGGTFNGNFYRELAVNWGLGLRFDFSILILRLDLGVAARKPWLPQGERWDFNLRPGDPTWRKENLYLNLAIGYPF